jgi:hypothetical protein
MIPKQILPKGRPYGGIIVVDPEKNEPDSFIKLIQDPQGKDIGHLT